MLRGVLKPPQPPSTHAPGRCSEYTMAVIFIHYLLGSVSPPRVSFLGSFVAFKQAKLEAKLATASILPDRPRAHVTSMASTGNKFVITPLHGKYPSQGCNNIYVKTTGFWLFRVKRIFLNSQSFSDFSSKGFGTKIYLFLMHFWFEKSYAWNLSSQTCCGKTLTILWTDCKVNFLNSA